VNFISERGGEEVLRDLIDLEGEIKFTRISRYSFPIDNADPIRAGEFTVNKVQEFPKTGEEEGDEVNWVDG